MDMMKVRARVGESGSGISIVEIDESGAVKEEIDDDPVEEQIPSTDAPTTSDLKERFKRIAVKAGGGGPAKEEIDEPVEVQIPSTDASTTSDLKARFKNIVKGIGPSSEQLVPPSPTTPRRRSDLKSLVQLAIAPKTPFTVPSLHLLTNGTNLKKSPRSAWGKLRSDVTESANQGANMWPELGQPNRPASRSQLVPASQRIRAKSAAAETSQSDHRKKTSFGTRTSTKDEFSDIIRKMKVESRQRRLSRMTPEQRDHYRRKQKATLNTVMLISWWKRQNDGSSHQIVDTEGEKVGYREKCRHAIRMIIMMNKTLLAMIDISANKTKPTAAEMQFHTLHSESDSMKVVFHRTMYSTKPGESRVPIWAKIIMMKAADQRTEAECKKIHALVRGLKAFDKFTYQVQLAMCRAFTYQWIHAKRLVLRKGHVGFGFYFIYSGSVFVNVEDVIPATGDKFFKSEVVLSRGDAFGELALLRDIRRTASISCRESSELLCVDKEVFATVCPKIFDKELKEKIDYLSNLPFFRDWYNDAELQSVCFDSQIQEYKINKVISPDTSSDEWIHVCMEGKFRVIKTLVIDNMTIATRRDSLCDLSNEDTVLTASHRQPLHRAKSRSGSLEASNQENSTHNRAMLLDSLQLGYANQPHAKGLSPKGGRNSTVQLSISEHPQNTKNLTVDAEIKRLHQWGKLTLRVFMELEKQKYEHSKVTFLDVGTFTNNEVFNLMEAIKPSGNRFVIVSLGAKVLRVKKSTFIKVSSLNALEHAKILAMKNPTPTNDTIMYLYQEHIMWEAYKQTVVDSTLSGAGRLSRRNEVHAPHLRQFSPPWRQQPMNWLKSFNRQHRKQQDERMKRQILASAFS